MININDATHNYWTEKHTQLHAWLYADVIWEILGMDPRVLL